MVPPPPRRQSWEEGGGKGGARGAPAQQEHQYGGGGRSGQRNHKGDPSPPKQPARGMRRGEGRADHPAAPAGLGQGEGGPRGGERQAPLLFNRNGAGKSTATARPPPHPDKPLSKTEGRDHQTPHPCRGWSTRPARALPPPAGGPAADRPAGGREGGADGCHSRQAGRLCPRAAGVRWGGREASRRGARRRGGGEGGGWGERGWGERWGAVGWGGRRGRRGEGWGRGEEDGGRIGGGWGGDGQRARGSCAAPTSRRLAPAGTPRASRSHPTGRGGGSAGAP